MWRISIHLPSANASCAGPRAQREYEHKIRVKLRISESKECLFALPSGGKFVKLRLFFLLKNN